MSLLKWEMINFTLEGSSGKFFATWQELVWYLDTEATALTVKGWITHHCPAVLLYHYEFMDTRWSMWYFDWKGNTNSRMKGWEQGVGLCSTGLIVYFKRTTYLFICKDKYDRMCCVPCETLDSRLPVNDILAHFSLHRELQWILRQNQHMRLNKNITAIYHPPRQGLLWSHPISRWTNPWVWTHSGSHDLSQVPSEN